MPARSPDTPAVYHVRLQALKQLTAALDPPLVPGFDRNADGVLCYHSRRLKVEMGYAIYQLHDRKISSRKFTERVLIPTTLIPLTIDGKPVLEPEIETRIKHTMTSRGRHYASYELEIVRPRPTLEFELHVYNDFIDINDWCQIWMQLDDVFELQDFVKIVFAQTA